MNWLRRAFPWLIAAALLAGGVEAWHELQSGVVTERFRLADEFGTPVLRFSPAGSPNGVVALLVHGHQCNKAMMAPLARYLASRGVDAYSIDLPGHGESTQPFSTERSVDAVEAAVSEILQRTGAPAQRFVLIGHSFGAIAIAPAALHRDLLATVFVGPGDVEGLSPERPSNALVVTAENDYDFIQQYARSNYARLTGQAGHRDTGDVANRDARSWVVIPQAEHVSLLLDARVQDAVGRWIEKASNSNLSPKGNHGARAAVRATAFAFALCLMIGWLAARSMKPGIVSLPARFWSPLAALAGGLFVSVLLTNGVQPLEFLRLREGDAVASLIAAAGIVGFAIFAALDEKLSVRYSTRDLLLGVGMFACLYGVALFALDGTLYSVRMDWGDWQRMGTLVFTGLLAVPFFLLQEEMLLRLGAASRSALFATLYCIGGAVLLAVLVCWALDWLDGRLFRFNAGLAAILLYCAAASILFRMPSKNSAAGVPFSCLLAGWVVSVGFYHY